MINKCGRLLPFLIILVTMTILAVSVSAAVADDVYIYLPLVNQTSYSANTTWATVIGYPEGISQYTRSVVEISDGAFVFAGRWYESDNSVDPADALVSKITHHGTLVWQRRFDGYWADDLYDVEELPGGDLIVAGDAVSNAKPMNYTWLARLDGRGSIVWQKFYSLRLVEDLLPLSTGGFVLAGITNNNELWMAEFDAGGDIEWQNWFNGPIALSAAITEDGHGGFLVAGSWQTPPSGHLDVHVMRLSRDGSVLMTTAFGDEIDDYYIAHDLAADGGFFLAGATEDQRSTTYLWILKAGLDGNIQWLKKFDEKSEIAAIRALVDGGCLVAGGDGDQPWLLKIKSNGDPEWQRYYRPETPAWFEELRPVSWGGFILAGHVSGSGDNNTKTLLLKTDASGQVTDCPLDEAGSSTLVDTNLPSRSSAVTITEAPGVVSPGDLNTGDGSATQTMICRPAKLPWTCLVDLRR